MSRCRRRVLPLAPQFGPEGLSAQPSPRISGSVSAIIYYDFTSAESFVLNEIVRAIKATHEIVWRGVQADPTLPALMAALNRRALARLELEIADATRAKPDVQLALPSGKPNTRRALQAVASVERMHAARGTDFRTALFREYWWMDHDLSDMAVIRRVAAQVGVPPWVDFEHQAAQAEQVSWELAWQTERLGGVPRVIRSDGQILWGVSSESDAREFLAEPGP